MTASKAGDDGGEIWGGAAAPDQTCWELLGTGRLPGQRLLQATERELSVQGVVVMLGGSPSPSTCGSHPCDDGKCLGMLRSSRMAVFLVLECWKAAVRRWFSLFPFTEFNSSRKSPKPHLPLVQTPMPLEPLWGICATVPPFLWDPHFWGCGELSSDG